MKTFIALLALVAILATSVTALKRTVSSSIRNTNRFMFLEKFAFGTHNQGTMHYDFTLPQDMVGVQLCFFYDTKNDGEFEGSWDYVWEHKHKCSDIINHARPATGDKNSPCIPLTPGRTSGQEKFNDHTRPHFWYAALVNCNTKPAIEVDSFELHFQNGGGLAENEWSADQWGMYGCSIAMTIFYTLISIVHFFFYRRLTIRERSHIVMKWLNAILGCALVHQWFTMLHYVSYAHNGQGLPFFFALGLLGTIGSDLLLMTLLLCLATGLGILHNRIEKPIRLVVLVAVNFVLYIALNTWFYVVRDPSSTAHQFQSVWGGLILGLRMATLIWFGYNATQSLRRPSSRGKQKDFKRMMSAFSGWFFGVPLLVLFGAALSAWVREAFIAVTTSIVNLAALLAIILFVHSLGAAVLLPGISFNRNGGDNGEIPSEDEDEPYVPQ